MSEDNNDVDLVGRVPKSVAVVIFFLVVLWFIGIILGIMKLFERE